jgi:hypothetical protein
MISNELLIWLYIRRITYGEILLQPWLLIFLTHAYEREKNIMDTQLAKKDLELDKSLWHLGN